MTDQQIFSLIAHQIGLKTSDVSKAAAFFDEGATIPFIARYRKEATGGMDEVQLQKVRDELEFRRLLEQRRKTILDSIAKQEKLTPELEKAILECTDLTTLEDLYLPYKPKRKTKASVAIEKGLEPLADLIWEQKTFSGDPEELAAEYVDEEKGVASVEEALAGARDIVAERVSQHIEVREMLRDQFRNFGTLVAKKTDKDDDKATYETYYDFRVKVKFLKPYQTLAVDRGEREGILNVKMEVWEERTLEEIDKIVIEDDRSIFIEELEDAIEDAWKRLLYPSLEREIRNELTEQSGEHAIEMFAENVKNLLLQPPFSDRVVLGIDPGYRTGCKVAVVDPTGKYLDGTTIFPTMPHNKIAESKSVLAALVSRHKVDLIAIGNGTGSRETEQVVAELLSELRAAGQAREIAYMIVNEAGASVYSASEEAREEFPELEAAQRGNISIARRVQDPLAELVKIDPKSIGVGLYQHDVNQVKLARKLDDVVESCVNHVGVNLNTASSALLTYVSGFSKTIAREVVRFRDEKGGFSSRDQLQDVPGVGPFRFQQAAGFLRIPGSNHPLDNTAIHPESYEATEKLCDLLGLRLDELTEKRELTEQKLQQINTKKTAEQIGIGMPTLELIIENLLKPGRDPREDMPKPLLRQDVMKIEDLKEGTRMQGTVRNVVDFGAFVDIGVKVDGLLHISRMRTDGKRVENVMDEMSVGDVIEVEVVQVDVKKERIGLQRVD